MDTSSQSPLEVLPTSALALVFARGADYIWRTVPVAPLSTHTPAPVPAPALTPTPSFASHKAPPRVRLTKEQTSAIVNIVEAKNRAEGKAAPGFGAFVSALIRGVDPDAITLDWLLARNVTLRDLLRAAPPIPITDLFRAHIVQKLGDLVALGFVASDLTLNRTCFNVNHATQLFHVDYETLNADERTGGFDFTTVLTADPRFTCDELLTLGVTADRLLGCDDPAFPRRHFDAKLLSAVSLSPADWHALGLEARHLIALGVTPHKVRTTFYQWDLADVIRMFGMPPEWGQ